MIPRIVVFTTAYLPYIGGAELAINHISKRIPSMRFFIITARFSRALPRHEQKDNLEIWRVGLGWPIDKWLLPFLGYWKASGLQGAEKISLLWGMMISQGTLAAYFFKKTHPQIPFIVTLQEGDAETRLGRGRLGLIDFFWKKVLKKADGVTAISKYLADRARYAGFRKEPVIIPNGVEEKYFQKSSEDLAKSRQSLGIAPDEKVVISVSRLEPKNGLDNLLKASSLLGKRGIKLKLVLIGGGRDEKMLKGLTRHLNLHNVVVFLGPVNHADILRYYQISDVFARPSRSEGLGSAFLEAMAAGVPVVATAVGGIVDFIEDGKTGLLAKQDPEDIAQKIEAILEDPSLSERLKTAARALIKQKYLWSLIARKTETFFSSFL